MDKIITPIQELIDEKTKKAKVQLFIKREDTNHPTIQGNKYWKLLYNIEAAKGKGLDTLVTFGGAFSNHIYATAAAGQAFGLKTIGIIRGESQEKFNHTLRFAADQGMQFKFIDRTTYRNKNNPVFLKEIENEFPNSYIIPEGGTNELAIKGCIAFAKEIQQQKSFDIICLPVGTGGTISGLIIGYENKGRVLGFSSLKGNFLQKEVEQIIFYYNEKTYDNWQIETAYHFGGYARHQANLISFINTFKKEHSIALDPIYTGKMMFGIYDLMEKGYFPENSKILAIHTGGVQGIVGFNERFDHIIL